MDGDLVVCSMLHREAKRPSRLTGRASLQACADHSQSSMQNPRDDHANGAHCSHEDGMILEGASGVEAAHAAGPRPVSSLLSTVSKDGLATGIGQAQPTVNDSSAQPEKR